MDTPFYTVRARNGHGDEKLVSQHAYKKDALRVASRFVNASVVRTGRRTENEVYSHSNTVKNQHRGIFEKSSLRDAQLA